MNCHKYRFKALKQKGTWLKELKDIPYFHVIGNPELTKEYEFDFNENILYVKVADDYNSLPKKVISAYEAVNQEFTFKYIFKTDDDQFLKNINYLKTIKNILVDSLVKIHYAGYIVDVDKPYLSQYNIIHPELPANLPILRTKYCSGRFYALSDMAVQNLITKKQLIQKEYLEDYAIGFHLHSILKINMLHINTSQYFTEFESF